MFCSVFNITAIPLVIKIFLSLVIGSVIVFIAADLCAWLGFRNLTFSLAQFGSAVMMGAFVLLSIKGLLALFKTVMLSVTDYFSSTKRSQRRVLFIQNKENQLIRLLYFRKMQLRYFNRQKIKQLLTKNNRQQLRSLSKSVEKDLKAIKKNIPSTTFKQLQQENRSYRNRQDIEALLKLQQHIASLV